MAEEYVPAEPDGEHDWDQDTNNGCCQEKQANIPCKALVPVNQTGAILPVSQHHQVAQSGLGLAEVEESPINNYNVKQSGGYFQLGSNNTQITHTQNITLILPSANASTDLLQPGQIIVGL